MVTVTPPLWPACCAKRLFRGRARFRIGHRCRSPRHGLSSWARQFGRREIRECLKDTLNSRVKHRQAFRPFAPVVLAERAGEIFEDAEPSPFMLIAKRVRPQWRDRIPAVVHVDGTARLQTVSRDDNARLYDLIKAFDALTGVPVLLNTSLNVRGEPIVETPDDAVACFLGTGIDVLVLHDTLVAKTFVHRLSSPFRNTWSEMTHVVRRGLAADEPDGGTPG